MMRAAARDGQHRGHPCQNDVGRGSFRHGQGCATTAWMTCSQCGAVVQPNSGFCGACGRPVAAPQPQQPYPPQGYAPHQPQGARPQAAQPQGYPPPQQQPHGYAPPQPGYPQPQQQQQGHAGSMRPFPIIMQQRFTRLTGQMFLAPARLYFICESNKGGLAVALGKGVGGLIGGAIASFGAPTPGQAAPAFDEASLYRAVQERPGSLVMEPQHIKAIKDTWLTHAIWFNGLTYALPGGLAKDLKHELGLWCQAHNVKNAGLLPK